MPIFPKFHWSLFLCGLIFTQTVWSKSPSPLHCKVAIVGGGVGGLHTAFRLGPSMGRDVCLFEKEATLGGRIRDVTLNDQDPLAPRFGVGARRVMEGQEVLFLLADELGLSFETPAVGTDLIQARGTTSFSKDELWTLAYPTLPAPSISGIDQETWLLNQLRLGPARARVQEYPDFESYVKAVVGHEGWQFLRDVSRFRADFEYPLDARGYLDYLDEEWDVCCTPSYPVGGMSAFVRGMELRAVAAGVRIFKGEAVFRMDPLDKTYKLKTQKRQLTADQLIIAVPPYALKSMQGSVVDRIKAQKPFQDILGVKVATITQWWPEAWWLGIKNPASEGESQVWRAWTTESCLNFIEIPLEPYAAAQKVTRSVYDDHLPCVEFWERTAKTSIKQVEAEIHRGLSRLFQHNGASVPNTVSIPQPLKTHVQIWPAAWHWLKAGTTYTNAQIVDWAVEPFPGENIALVGEAYNPQRSGWSDAAFKSSIHLLKEKFGLD